MSHSPDSISPLPLAGKTILVTRAAGQSSQFATLLQAQGATVLEMPALEIAPPSTWDALDQAIARLTHFDWLILTSTNGADYFFERLAAQGKTLDALAAVKIAVVGKKTATSLTQRGLIPDFIPPNFVADTLVATFPERDRLKGLNILFPRVETGGREVLVQEFTAEGAIVTEVAAYQSCCAQQIPPDVLTALQANAIDVITFASSKTVQCVHQLLASPSLPPTSHPPSSRSHPSSPTQISNLKPQTSSIASICITSICIASIGPQTSLTCQQLLGRVDVEAEEYTLEGLTQAIARWAEGCSVSKGQ